jgi:cytochrome d ubiquinol oxidase subunit I
MIATLWAWHKKRLIAGMVSSQKKLLIAWMAAAPLNYVAMEAGWVTREVGRQPFIIYGIMKTSESSSPLPAFVGVSLFIFIFAYLMLFIVFVVLAWFILKRGPVHEADSRGGV